MLPSMRYETKKLAELYHMKKSYKEHRNSVSKIMNKSLNSSLNRTKQLNELRNRMHSSFNHTQYVRAKEIQKNNEILYHKCSAEMRRKPAQLLESSYRSQNTSLENGQDFIDSSQIKQRDFLNPRREAILLKNHRNESIGKLTGYDRTKQNFRLAVKITQPCPTINTKKLEQIHQEAKRRKQRIMRYDSTNLKYTIANIHRSQKYLQKRFSVSSIHSKNQISHSASSANNKKFSSTAAYGGITNYIKKNKLKLDGSNSSRSYENKKRFSFKGKINHDFTFY